MQIKQVVFVSHVAPSVLAADAEAIAARASERNADSGLTGFLLYSPRFFLQVLEGDESLLDETMSQIEKDSRHRDVRILGEASIYIPHFASWSLGFASVPSMDDELPAEWTMMKALEFIRATADSVVRAAAP